MTSHIDGLAPSSDMLTFDNFLCHLPRLIGSQQYGYIVFQTGRHHCASSIYGDR